MLHVPGVLVSPGDTSSKGLAGAAGELLQTGTLPVEKASRPVAHQGGKWVAGSEWVVKKARVHPSAGRTYVTQAGGVCRAQMSISCRQTRNYAEAQPSQALPSQPMVMMARSACGLIHAQRPLCVLCSTVLHAVHTADKTLVSGESLY